MLFLIAFVSVFLLGFQQQNVQHNKHIYAAITSFLIAFSQFMMYRLAVAADANEWVYMGAGGALGIVTSMIVHKKLREMKYKNWRVNNG